MKTILSWDVGIKNLAYCIIQIDKESYKIIGWDKINLIGNKKCKECSIIDFSLSIVNKLDQIPALLQVDEVIIENQPSLRNPKMKTISSFLFMYFTLRGVSDNNSTIKNITFISPCNKLKVNHDKTAELLNVNKNQKYKMTKQLAIDYVRILLKDVHKEWLKQFESYKKKDDMADAFLQGYYYLFL